MLVKTGLLAIITNIVLNYFLIKNYGVEGAVLSTILSNFILILLLLNFTKSVNQFSWPMKKIVHGAIIASLIIIIFKTIQEFAIDYIFVVKCLLLIMFPILSIFTNLGG